MRTRECETGWPYVSAACTYQRDHVTGLMPRAACGRRLPCETVGGSLLVYAYDFTIALVSKRSSPGLSLTLLLLLLVPRSMSTLITAAVELPASGAKPCWVVEGQGVVLCRSASLWGILSRQSPHRLHPFATSSRSHGGAFLLPHADMPAGLVEVLLVYVIGKVCVRGRLGFALGHFS